MKLTSLMIGTPDSKVLSEFYAKVLNVEIAWMDDDWCGVDFGGYGLVFGPHDKVTGPNAQPERMMLNFETPDIQKDFDRIKGLGAKVIRAVETDNEESGSMQVGTFEDPDGNYFQIMSPWEEA